MKQNEIIESVLLDIKMFLIEKGSIISSDVNVNFETQDHYTSSGIRTIHIGIEVLTVKIRASNKINDPQKSLEVQS